MLKQVIFYGVPITLRLHIAGAKEVPDYIKTKLMTEEYYIQKKHDGRQFFFYRHVEGNLSNYYFCEVPFFAAA